jgi:hypothetical protein
MTNAVLAAQLRAQADDHLNQRRVLLTASVALANTPTPVRAAQSIRQSGIPLEVAEAAATLIENMAAEMASGSLLEDVAGG